MKSTSMGTPGDFNTPTEVGSWYYYGDKVQNSPDGSSIAYGRRAVLYSRGNDVFEFYYSFNNNKFYFRGRQFDSVWTEISLV